MCDSNGNAFEDIVAAAYTVLIRGGLLAIRMWRAEAVGEGCTPTRLQNDTIWLYGILLSEFDEEFPNLAHRSVNRPRKGAAPYYNAYYNAGAKTCKSVLLDGTQ